MTATAETTPESIPPRDLAPASKRLLSLDVLRAVAIALVLIRHFEVAPDLNGSISLLLRTHSGLHGIAAAVIASLYRVGWVGVDLFFVLSGFLVSGLLFSEFRRTGSLNIARFLVRRGFKIYPSFYTFLCLVTVISALAGHPPSIRPLLGELLFLQNYIGKLWNHTWSLAVEEHFYLLLAAGFYFATRRPSADCLRFIPHFFVAVAALLLGARLLHAWDVPFSFETHVEPTHFRIDSLLFGVVIAYFYHTHPASFIGVGKRYARLLVPGGFVLLLLTPMLFPLYTFIGHTVNFTLLYLAAGLILWGAVSVDIRFSTASRLAAYIGAHSYPIYLWHMPVFTATHTLLGGRVSLVTQNVLATVLSIAIGISFSKVIEFPTLRLRDRLFPAFSSSRTPPSLPRQSMS